MKIAKKILFFFLILLLLIQFYPLEKPEVTLNNPNDFLKNKDVPQKIAQLIKTSCYDCHSNETKFPWYSKFAPVKWLVYHDINEGREELNFSEWNKLSEDDKSDKLFDIQDEMSEGEMPIKIYTFMHQKAKLTEEQRILIASFVENLAE